MLRSVQEVLLHCQAYVAVSCSFAVAETYLTSQVIPGRAQINFASLEKSFTFDYAYGQSTEQKEVYSTGVQEMIEKLFNGFNVTVLAYGQTGSGKTHTMGTAFNSETTDNYVEGIIPRAVRVSCVVLCWAIS